MIGLLGMQAATLADVGLLLPELILVGACLVVVLVARRIRRGRVAGILTLMASLAAALAIVLYLPDSRETGFGNMLVVDGYSKFFKLLSVSALVAVTLVARRSVDSAEVPQGEFHALLLLATTGMMVAISALDLITLYLGLELMTVCSFVLVGIAVQRPDSNEAAIKYFLLGSFASAVLLFGISLTYGLSGSTDFETLAAALAARESASDALVFAAVGLVLAGLAFKVAAVPFHAWAPDAYQGSLTPVAAFLATGSKAAGLAALGRVTLIAFEYQQEHLAPILMGLAALSILTGSLLALPQTELKRLLAYSSIAHAGYALMGLSSGSAEGAQAMMTYSLFYVFMTLGAFGVVLALGQRGERLEGFEGLASQRPVTAAVMLLFLLSLTGVPPTAGFVAKFAVILSVVKSGNIWLAVLAVVCSVVSAFVYLRIVVLMYMKEPRKAAPATFPFALTAVLALAAFVTLIGGMLPSHFTSWAVAP